MVRLRTCALALAAFALSTAQLGAAEPIRIGAVGPLTGPAANSGISMKQAFEYVVQKANEDGGLAVGDETRKIEILFEDDQSRPEQGVSAAQKLLTRDNVDILIGDMFHSSVTLAVMDLALSFNDRFFMSGQPVSMAIAQKIKENPEGFSNFWKAGFNSDAYGETVFQTIKSLIDSGKIDAGDKRIAFVVEDTDYGKSNVEFVHKHFANAGWSVSMNETVPLGHAEFYPQISKLNETPPDVLVSVFTSVNSGIALVKQAEEKGLEAAHMAIYYPLRPEFLEGAGASADGLVWTPLFFDPAHNEKHAGFAETFSKAMDVDATGDHAQGVCHMGLLLENIEKAGSLETEALTKAFESTDHECVLGRWVFNEDTHSPKTGAEYLPVPAAQIQKGDSYVIWPSGIATADYKSM